MSWADRRASRRAARTEFGRRGTATKYRMREKLLSIGDDYWIETSEGDRMYRVDGKAARLRRTLDLYDQSGRHISRVQSRAFRVRDTMQIKGPDGNRLATVRKALVSPLRHRWHVDIEAGESFSVQGNVVDHEYRMERDGRKVAEVSKRWFRVRDTYGIQILPAEDAPLMLAVAVALEAMTHPD